MCFYGVRFHIPPPPPPLDHNHKIPPPDYETVGTYVQTMQCCISELHRLYKYKFK